MANVHDVAAYILQKCGKMSTWRLQKLAYYCQAWSSVWDDRPMFPEEIRAWANGPVIPALYDKHRGLFDVSEWPYGNPEALDEAARETVDAVLEAYGDKSGQWLSDMTHSEMPWQKARVGVPNGERSNRPISLEDMAEYYSSLTPERSVALL